MQMGVEVEVESGRGHWHGLTLEGAVSVIVDLESKLREGEKTSVIVGHKSATWGDSAKNAR